MTSLLARIGKILSALLFLVVLTEAYDCSGTSRPLLRLYSGYSSRGQGHLRDDVIILQRALNFEGGYSLKVDGYFGPSTELQVRKWQVDNELDVDGIVGVKTWNSLCDSSVEDSIPGDLIGPTQWCSNGYWPSREYTVRIVKPAWRSGGKTYYNLAVAVGQAEGVHPALLAAHMVQESSMGKNNQCTRVGKSALTGCTWYPSCSSGCKCTGRFVTSDEKQVQCTAGTDKNAYLEATTGARVGNGAYVKCSEYNGDRDKMWKCIFCVYQGNYDKDLTNSGKPYFTKDGTCEYAEKFKTEFCNWAAYFDN